MGDNAIHYLGHVKMMAAVQPFISGAISKTVNMPEDVTVEDVEQLHIDSWKMGLKAVAIYRDNCKVGQPLSMAKKGADSNNEVAAVAIPATAEAIETIHRQGRGPPRTATSPQLPRPTRSRWPTEGYFTVGEYEDGTPGEAVHQRQQAGFDLGRV